MRARRGQAGQQKEDKVAKGNDMMKQIQALQSKMAQAQESLAETVIEGSAGGGVVQVSDLGATKTPFLPFFFFLNMLLNLFL